VFLDTFWRNDLSAEVFVAISFDKKYDHRWCHVIKPAIQDEPLDAEPFGSLRLTASRVDIRQSGDSILTDICNGIAHAQLVLADISVTDRWAVDGKARNGNVMYEVGLALACRQPVEVILVRDDDEPLLFDVSTIRVIRIKGHEFDQIKCIRQAIQDRLRERDLIKDMRAVKVVESLSKHELAFIRHYSDTNDIDCSGGDAIGAMAVSKLLEKYVWRLTPSRSLHLDGFWSGCCATPQEGTAYYALTTRWREPTGVRCIKNGRL
jgi:hypothetical protein